MKFKTAAFRFRAWIFLGIYLLGFWAPWERFTPGSRRERLWLAAPALLSRTGWMDLAAASHLVTLAALAACLAGAILRVCGTAYLGTSVMGSPVFESSSLVAAGPYRRLRNPLYLGSALTALGVSILMPPLGALVFLLAFCFFAVFLIFAEERFLSAELGAAYDEYRRRVPRLMPSPVARISASPARPHWLQAFFAEIFSVGYALCFAFLAWRYSGILMIRCLIVCFGLSIIARAMRNPSNRASEASRREFERAQKEAEDPASEPDPPCL